MRGSQDVCKPSAVLAAASPYSSFVEDAITLCKGF